MLESFFRRHVNIDFTTALFFSDLSIVAVEVNMNQAIDPFFNNLP